jgi:hypothetical protein
MRHAVPYPVEPDPYRLALFGSGAQSTAWLAALTRPEAANLGARLALVCGLGADGAGGILSSALPQGCVVSHDLANALGLRPDIVIDATSPVARWAITRAAMQAGVHVLCDPPLALDGMTALMLVGASAREPGRLCVGYLSRHAPGLRQMRGLVQSAQLGQPLALRVGLSNCDVSTVQKTVRGPVAEACDAARAILGCDGRTVSCQTAPFMAEFEMAGPASLSIALRPGPAQWQLECEGGTISAGLEGPAIWPDGVPVASVDGDYIDERLVVLGGFVQAIRTGSDVQSGPRSAAASLAMALAAHASALDGGKCRSVMHLGLMGDASDTPIPRNRATASKATEAP